MKKIYSLGTSKRTLDEFLKILKFYRIQVVIDVRRWPTSKWFEHFKKENLEKILAENNIEYCHFEKLGGYREGGYEKYTKTKEFKEALKELIKISKFQNIVLICAERLPWQCHRAIIAKELGKKKFEVFHIIDQDYLWQSKAELGKIRPLCQKKLFRSGIDFLPKDKKIK